jgi:N-acetylated-alpha-linked acidic dipeptidase
VVQTYVNEVERLAASQSSEIRERNREISEGIFKVSGDAASAPPQPEAVPPDFDFAPLEAAARALDRSAAHYRQALARAEDNQGAALANASLARVNEEMLRCEQALTDPAGLPGRPWFKHQLYAPGLYTGYAVKTIPAVREALEQKQWSLVNQAIPTVARALASEASAVDRAAGDLEATIQ